MFVQIAIGAIAIGVVVMLGYLIVAYVRNSLPTTGLNESVTQGMDNAQTVVFAGFALIAVGIIVLAAFGLISVFK
jgi:hypothetical protein